MRPFCFRDAMTTLASEDPRTTAELFAASLEGDYDDGAPWRAVAALRLRGTKEVFDFATEYCGSKDAKVRDRGLDVLAQLGAGKEESQRPYLHQCVSIAIEALKDTEPIVVHSAAWALSHLRTESAVAALLRLKRHAQPEIRWAVATGIGGTVHKSPEGIAALIELTADVDEDVRDWAAFGLGSQSDEDSLEIRETLRNRLTDSFEPVRSEAVWGLAHRKDPYGLRMLLKRLDADTWQTGDELAALEILGLSGEQPIETLCDGLKALIR